MDDPDSRLALAPAGGLAASPEAEAAARPAPRRDALLGAGQWTGLAVLAVPVAFALLAPLLIAGDPARQSLVNMLQPPSAAHPFGTDHLGRELALRVASALRLSLTVGLGAALLSALAGTAAGVAAASRGGWLDRMLSILADVVLSVPGLLLVLLIAAISPGRMWPIYLGISLTLSIEFFRLSRAETARIVAGSGVTSARMFGLGGWFVFRHHIWPVIGPLILTLVAMGTGTAILSVAALGFVSVGVRPPRAELGQMMVEMLPYYAEGPWVIAFPALALFLCVLGLTLLAGGRR